MESKNWVNGEWTVPAGGELPVQNPSNTAEQVGVIHLSTTEDVDAAAEAARKAAPGWAGLTGAQRGEVLRKMAAQLEARREEISQLASSEMGKPISEMRGEVTRGVMLLHYYAAEGVRANGSVIPSNEGNVLQYSKRVPLGVVGLITPWNFPVAIPVWKLAPALICGNTVVWKPAENASLTATKMTEIFAEAGLPAGVLNLVIGRGSVVGSHLIENGGLDGLSFTGSTATGRLIAAACAAKNIKFQTEMGGKNAAVVLDDANLDTAVSAIVSGAFRSAGQKCTATSRIIVQQGIYDAFTEKLQQAVKSLYVGHALDDKSYMGPVASVEQYRKVSSYVDIARAETTILAEGTATVDPSQGFYVMPLVTTGVKTDHALVQEEVFGPVTVVLPVVDLDEAMAACNQTEYGLSASIFTQHLPSAMTFLDRAEVGMVRVNQETAGVEYQSPFGGMKLSSSHTREQGQAALDFYSQVKTCAIAYSM